VNRPRLLLGLALAFVAGGAVGALLAPPPPVIAVRASHAAPRVVATAPAAPAASARLRTDI